MSDPTLKTAKVPMLDTGIGREAGYRDDAEFVAAMQAEREAMRPDLRQVLDQVDAEVERRLLFGGKS